MFRPGVLDQDLQLRLGHFDREPDPRLLEFANGHLVLELVLSGEVRGGSLRGLLDCRQSCLRFKKILPGPVRATLGQPELSFGGCFFLNEDPLFVLDQGDLGDLASKLGVLEIHLRGLDRDPLIDRVVLEPAGRIDARDTPRRRA